MPPYRVAAALPGALWIMPHPPAERLAGTLAELRRAGIGRVFSLLPEAEEAALGLAAEPAACAAEGLSFSRFPIEDFQLPAPGPFAALVTELARDLGQGAQVVLHCRAGIGRSGLLAACTLVALGTAPSAAIAQVSAARGREIPDTEEQRAFILAFRPGP
jgi:protein-tyrosine phosphatase